MADTIDDRLAIRDAASGEEVVVIAGADIDVGGAGQAATFDLRDASGRRRFSVNCANGVVVLRDEDGTGRLRINVEKGRLLIRDDDGTTVVALDESGVQLHDGDGNRTVHLRENGTLRLGGNSHSGQLVIRRSSNQPIMRLDGENGNLFLGGNGADGDISLFPASMTGQPNAQQDPSITMSGDGGDMTLRGDIRFANADAAEDFDAEDADLEPGDVVSLGPGSRLVRSTCAYDRTVVGVISGAGRLRPGIRLNSLHEGSGRRPVSLMGTTYCKVDAEHAPIGVGDPLTTSATPGHAMLAADATAAFGAVIGKSLAELPSGRELVPIVVSLQ